MTIVKVVDLNEAVEQPSLETENIEEANEQQPEIINEVVEEAPAPVETVEQPKETPEEKEKPKAKTKG